MKNSFKYSIIYAVLRPEISEQISVGLITIVGEKVDIRISTHKLKALRNLFSEKEYQFVSSVVSQMKRNNRVNSVEAINYLTRYSNNMIAFSPLQNIDIEPTEQSRNRLYKNYVYSRAHRVKN